MIKRADMSNHYAGMRYRPFIIADTHQEDVASGGLYRWLTNQSPCLKSSFVSYKSRDEILCIRSPPAIMDRTYSRFPQKIPIAHAISWKTGCEDGWNGDM